MHKRDLPWRRSSDPYAIWVSEIMLQQTRVDTVIPYFYRFLERFPTVCSLAEAPLDDLFKIWEGLGYYRRAVNMKKAAQTVCDELEGRFPTSSHQLQELSGIGPYTSAAIASIAFQEPAAAVDGNVIRVMTRYYGIESDIRKTKTQKEVRDAAGEAISNERPGAFNQALMDLGSGICTPSSPECGACPLSVGCAAFQQVKTDTIPYKSPGKKVPHHEIGVGVIQDHSGALLIAKRPLNGLLGGLWEFPGGKKEPGETLEACVIRELQEELGCVVEPFQKIAVIDHAYSHFKITMHAYLCRLKTGEPQALQPDEIRWVNPDELDHFSFPKANKMLIRAILELG